MKKVYYLYMQNYKTVLKKHQVCISLSVLFDSLQPHGL